MLVFWPVRFKTEPKLKNTNQRFFKLKLNNFQKIDIYFLAKNWQPVYQIFFNF